MDSPRRKTGHPSGSAARARASAAPTSAALSAKSVEWNLQRPQKRKETDKAQNAL